MATETLSFLISAFALLISFSLLIFLILRASSRTKSPLSAERARCLSQLAELSGAYTEFAESLTEALAGQNAVKIEGGTERLTRLMEQVADARSQLKSHYGVVLDGKATTGEALADIGRQIEALRQQLAAERALADEIRAGRDALMETPVGSQGKPD